MCGSIELLGRIFHLIIDLDQLMDLVDGLS